MAADFLPVFFVFLVTFSRFPISTATRESEFSDDLHMAIDQERVEICSDISRKTMPISKPLKDRRMQLDIYCFQGLPRRDLWRLWSTASIQMMVDQAAFAIFQGQNESDVYHQYKENAASWFALMTPWQTDNVVLPIFNRSCIAIDTEQPYTLKLVFRTVDLWLLGLLLTGILLFLLAPKLSRNIMFYYGTGMTFGVIASVLILVFILSRFIPKKYGGYFILVGGWSIALFLLQSAWTHVELVLSQYPHYVIAYLVTAAVISFAVLYYKGPVTNPRLIDLIKWSLQLVALVFIFNGTQLREVSIAIIAVVLLAGFCPTSFLLPMKGFWRRKFPKKRRLLTEAEYLQEAEVKTRNALAELREYCRSPGCDAWKTMSRLKSPQRFAKWVEGDSHLSEDEMYAYDDGWMPRLPRDSDEESELSFRLNAP